MNPLGEISGWSDDSDAIMPGRLELITVKHMADGAMLANRTGRKGGEITLKFRPTAPAVGRIMVQAELFKKGAEIVWDGSIENTVYGYGWSFEEGFLQEVPLGMTHGASETANMEFKWIFENVSFNFEGAKFTDYNFPARVA